MNNERVMAPFEVKALNDEGEIEGYGAVFGNVDGGDDLIVPGAFDDTLRKSSDTGRMPAFLHYHRPDMICGTWSEMRADNRGLYCKGRFLLETQCGRDRHAEAKAGALTGLSIGYRVDGDDGSEYRTENENLIRVLKRVKLFEVSCVAFPMNEEARITNVKSEVVRPATVREFERALREVLGFSHAHAKAIASRGFKAIDVDPREAVGADGTTTSQDPRDEDGEKALNDVLASLKGVRSLIKR